MSQPTLGTHYATIPFENGKPTKDGLRKLFFDLDFIENDEYFREDTLELGFESEADRIAIEVSKEDLTCIEMIDACIKVQTKDSFYTESEVHTTVIDNEDGISGMIIVSVAYMSNC